MELDLRTGVNQGNEDNVREMKRGHFVERIVKAASTQRERSWLRTGSRARQVKPRAP